MSWREGLRARALATIPRRGAAARLAPVLVAGLVLLTIGLGQSGPATAVADPASSTGPGGLFAGLFGAQAGDAGANPADASPSGSASATPTQAPSPIPATALQARLDYLRTQYRVPGVSVTIIWPDGRTWTGVSGWANLARRVPVVSGTAFPIGSVTKTFMATLVLELVEEGKLSLDDRVRYWLPTARVSTSVRIRQLLDHTSGVYDFFSNPTIDAAILGDKRRVWSVSRSLSYVRAPYCSAGHCWHYSNTNYALLGQIVSRVTGHSATTELRRRYWDPLGMTRTFMQSTESRRGTVATSYELVGPTSTARRISLSDGTTISPFTSVVTAARNAGAVAASSRDLAIWAHSLYGGSILSPASLAAMLDVRRSVSLGASIRYGFGVMEQWFGGRHTYGHNGRLIGARASIRYLPELGFTIAVVTNQDRTGPDVFGTALMNIATKPVLPPPSPIPSPTPTPVQ